MAISLKNSLAEEVLDDNGKEFKIRADSYLNTVLKSLEKPGKLGPDLLYNLCAMAIEGFVMDYSLRKGSLPGNHTMQDMWDHLSQFMDLEDSLKEAFLKMDAKQNLCSLDPQEKAPTVSREEVQEFAQAAVKLQALLA